MIPHYSPLRVCRSVEHFLRIKALFVFLNIDCSGETAVGDRDKAESGLLAA
jgi:hypothetical protein